MSITYQSFEEMNEERLETLYNINNKIFSEFSGDLAPFPKEKLANVAFKMSDFFITFAFDGDSVVGFKAGYRHSGARFYSWLGGVQSDQRGKGIAKELMNIQHQWAKEKGFTVIETRTKNTFKNMLITNLKQGFHITGTMTGIGDSEVTIVLEKKL